jgi:hypothetical protein
VETSGDSREESVAQRLAAGFSPRAVQSDSTLGAPAGGLVRPARGFVRFLYSSNPFYIVSADLVFIGLRMTFHPGGSAAQSWALMMTLAGYTLLLATTACFLIRVGKLWDDLRSLLILIVMMFMAMTLCADETMAADPRHGTVACIGVALFAIVVTEAVLRSIRLRLPGWYRVAYYLILAQTFLYPIALIPVMNDPDGPRAQWALFGFAVLAGLVLTSLVPAARGGAALVANNGSPWRWPLYPWSLFVVMAAGLGARCYSICVSFHYVQGSGAIFGPYFLVPIGIAVSMVWLEIGIAARRRAMMTAAAAAPLFLVCLAAVGHRDERVYAQFLQLFMTTLGGSPAFLTLIAATVVLAYAAVRRVPLAFELLAVGIAALAVVGPRTITLADTVSPQWLPLAAAGMVLATAAVRHCDSLRATLSAAFFVGALSRVLAYWWPDPGALIIALHLSITAMLVIGVVFDDWLARLARICGALALLVLGVIASADSPMIYITMSPAIATWYPLFAIALTWSIGYLMRDRFYLGCAALNLAAWLVYSGSEAYRRLHTVVAGLDQIFWGMVFFLIATAISLTKAGICTRARMRSISGMLVRAFSRPAREADRIA